MENVGNPSQLLKIAVIPARGGSKRIKNKNIIEFCGKPLISYSLEAARNSEIFDVIHVSTDSPEIASVVEKLGYKVDFMRPAELSDDYTPLSPVLQWVVKEYAKKEKYFSTVGLVMPCAPLITPDDLKGAFDIYNKNHQKFPVMAVSPFSVPVEWAFNRNDDGTIKARHPEKLSTRSQDLPTSYFDTGTFYFFSADSVAKNPDLTQEQFFSYILPKTKSVDIDTHEDLLLAETLFKGLKKLSHE